MIVRKIVTRYEDNMEAAFGESLNVFNIELYFQRLVCKVLGEIDQKM